MRGLGGRHLATVCSVLLLLLAMPAMASAVGRDGSEAPHPATEFTVKPGWSSSRPRVPQTSALKLSATVTPTAPFTQCPAVGNDTSCGLLIDVTNAGVSILGDPTQGPYDGIEDTLIGVLNQSSKSLGHLALTSDTDIFGFDGDGICAYGLAGCPFGPTGYEGPGTSFSAVSPDFTSGEIDFSPELQPGESTYFSLEEPLDATAVVSGGPSVGEQGGARNGSEYSSTCHSAWPVNCATGVFWHEFEDANVPGLGVPLNLTRTYSSANAEVDGPFGFGWSNSYGMSLGVDAETGAATVHEEGGSTVTFPPDEGGGFMTPPRVLAALAANEDGTYSFTRFKTHVTYVFGADGRLLREEDRNGNTTTLSYSGGRLQAVTDPSGRSLEFTYSGAHVSSVVDPMGRTTSFAYDGSGNLAEAIGPLGRTWSFAYDTAHRMLTMTDPRGGSTANTYDFLGRVVAQVDPAGRESTWSYEGDPTSPEGGSTDFTDPRGDVTRYRYRNLELVSVSRGVGTFEEATTSYRYDPTTLGVTRIEDPDGYLTFNAYDSHGNLTETTNQDGWTTTYEYGPLDEVAAATDPRGTTTSYVYDSSGNLLEKSTPLTGTGEVATTTYSYEVAPGEVTGVTDPDGNVTHVGYDSHGNRTGLTDPNGNETSFEYDPDGELTARVGAAGNAPGGDPDAHRTTFTYDAAGELLTEADPLGHVTEFAYDAAGDRISVKDAMGRTSHRTYDADGELTKLTRPDESVLENEWDAAGNLVAQVDAAGHRTTYSYDALDRKTSITDPDGRSTYFGYDRAGNRTSIFDPEGQTTEISYDGTGRVTAIYYSDGTTPDVFQYYDEDGNRVYRYDGTGESIYAYDSLNRLTEAKDGSDATVNYSYDLAGRLLDITYPDGHEVERTYDPAGDLTTVTDWLGHTTHFAYDAEGNPTEVVYPNGVVTNREFDAANRLNSIHDEKTGGSLASFEYSRDAVGDVSAEAVVNGASSTTNFNHDQVGRLTAAGAETYGYDTADNPTAFGNERTQAFDPANQLLTSVGPATEGPGEEEPGGGSGGGSGGEVPPDEGGGGGAHPQAPPTPQALIVAKKVQNGKLSSPRLPGSAAGDLLLAFVSVGGKHQQVTGVSGAGLRWSAVGRAHGSAGSVEVWQARAGSQLSGKVTARLRRHSRSGMLVVAAFPGSTSVFHGVASHGAASAPSSRLVKGPAASIWAVGRSAGQSQATRVPASQAIAAQLFDRRGHSASWVQSIEAGEGEKPVAKGRAASWTMVAVSLEGAAAGASASTASAGGRTRPAEPRAMPVRRVLEAPSRGFEYDARGNRVREEADGLPALEYRYDQANRLVGVGLQIAYSYDGDGLRTDKTVAGAHTHFAWNVVEEVPELLEAGGIDYVYGPNGEAVEQISGSTPIYLQQDQLGSTRLLTDSAGSVVGRYDYGPWGAVSSHSGSASTDLQFDGEYTDPETDLQYLRSRYYDPTTGQFLSRDPLFTVTRTPFSFAFNDPVDITDPTGLWCVFGKNADGSCKGKSVFHAVAVGAGVVGVGLGVAALTVGTGGVGTVALGLGVGAIGATAGCIEEPGFTFGCGLGIATVGIDGGFALKGVSGAVSGGFDVFANSFNVSLELASGFERPGHGNGPRGGSCAIPTPYPQSTISGQQLQPAVGGFQ